MKTCLESGCERRAVVRGYCQMHYCRIVRREVPPDPLQHAEQAYANAVGIAARLFWRNKVNELKAGIE